MIAYLVYMPAGVQAIQVANVVAFEEREVVPLDMDGAVSGLEVSQDTWVAWRTAPPLVMIHRRGEGWVQLSADRFTAPVSVAAREEYIAVLDGDPPKVLRFSKPELEFQESIPLPTAGTIHSASPKTDGWLLASERLPGRISVTKAALTDGVIHEVPLIEVPFACHVRSTTNGEILVTGVLAPFPVLRVRESGEVEEFEPLEEDLVSAYDVSLPALALDEGYIQTLADTSSDRRVLILYSPQGELLRTISLEVAIGFVASDPKSQLLFGARQLGVQELVSYAWSWTKRDQTP